MESLRELYRIGPGPSSSHTLAIRNACLYFKGKYPSVRKCIVNLYGSLALTGKGHFTDRIIIDTFGKDNVTVNFVHKFNDKHPNALDICDADSEIVVTIYSIGGGAFSVEGETYLVDKCVYPHNSMNEIEKYCLDNNLSLFEYVLKFEPNILEHLTSVFEQMKSTIKSGLNGTGLLPGPLKLERIAKQLHEKAQCSNIEEKRQLYLSAYAYATSEENASGHMVVTAPTLGSCGVLPSLMYYYLLNKNVKESDIIEALAVAGLFGNVVKTNATISGAEGGCQAEIGVACAMAAAACSYLEGLSIAQICYAAEIGIEHHLGLTCDPVGGFVLIPCIERNGIATLRAYDAMLYAKVIGDIKLNKVSFDMVVQTMKYTGQKIALELKETALGGLALVLPIDEENA